MLVPLVGFVVLWVLAFVRWPNDSEGNTRTSVPWIVAGFIMLPLSIGAVALMSSTGVRQVATVEQQAQQPTRQPPAAQPTAQSAFDKEGNPCTEVTELLGECKRQP